MSKEITHNITIKDKDLWLLLEAVKGYKQKIENGFGFKGWEEKVKQLEDLYNTLDPNPLSIY